MQFCNVIANLPANQYTWVDWTNQKQLKEHLDYILIFSFNESKSYRHLTLNAFACNDHQVRFFNRIFRYSIGEVLTFEILI